LDTIYRIDEGKKRRGLNVSLYARIKQTI